MIVEKYYFEDYSTVLTAASTFVNPWSLAIHWIGSQLDAAVTNLVGFTFLPHVTIICTLAIRRPLIRNLIYVLLLLTIIQERDKW